MHTSLFVTSRAVEDFCATLLTSILFLHINCSNWTRTVGRIRGTQEESSPGPGAITAQCHARLLSESPNIAMRAASGTAAPAGSRLFQWSRSPCRRQHRPRVAHHPVNTVPPPLRCVVQVSDGVREDRSRHRGGRSASRDATAAARAQRHRAPGQLGRRLQPRGT